MKVSIIGVGRVGSTLAYTLVLRGVADELVLVDRNEHVALGESLDLRHAEAFTTHPMIVRPGTIDDTAGSDILIVTSSVPWKDAYSSRFDMGRDNLRIFEQIIPPLAAASPDSIVLVVTNPVDVMTYHALRLTGFGPERVFGSGTLIDSARFRTMLSAEMGIHPDDLRAYILGEHGDTQFPLFSMAMVGGRHIVEDDMTDRVFSAASRAGFDVVNQKGHTNFAISMAASLVVEAIAWNTRRTMPLSVLVDGFQGGRDVCLALPVVVGKDGITQVLAPDLSETEVAAFHRCAELVRKGIERSQQESSANGGT
jgi:L-lactate dehydrogenase